MAAGASVQEGDPLVVVEAMKMEHTGAGLLYACLIAFLSLSGCGLALPITQLASPITQFATAAAALPSCTSCLPACLTAQMLPPCCRPHPTVNPASRPPPPACPPPRPAVRAPCAGTVAELHSFVDAQVGTRVVGECVLYSIARFGCVAVAELHSLGGAQVGLLLASSVKHTSVAGWPGSALSQHTAPAAACMRAGGGNHVQLSPHL